MERQHYFLNIPAESAVRNVYKCHYFSVKSLIETKALANAQTDQKRLHRALLTSRDYIERCMISRLH